jgi:hypothetical protein
LKATGKSPKQKSLKELQQNKLYNTEMEMHAQDYAQYVIERYEEAKKQTPDAILCVEQRIEVSAYVPECFGTVDALIIADNTLEVIDLKYGKGVLVSSEENKQMMLYALGALTFADVLYDIETVSMTVYQPRLENISTWELSLAELLRWGENFVKPLAKLAYAGEGKFSAGEHCRFCAAKAQCKALADANLEVAKYEFQNPDLLSDKDICDILMRADVFINWIHSVEEYALDEAVNNGKHWDGFKLVEGRSNRKYGDEDKVMKTLLDGGYEKKQIVTEKLRGITDLQKILGKKPFETLVSPLLIKPEGKPTLVPESNKRAAIGSVESAIQDFK